jgi:hypothetical protein
MTLVKGIELRKTYSGGLNWDSKNVPKGSGRFSLKFTFRCVQSREQLNDKMDAFFGHFLF